MPRVFTTIRSPDDAALITFQYLSVAAIGLAISALVPVKPPTAYGASGIHVTPWGSTYAAVPQITWSGAHAVGARLEGRDEDTVLGVSEGDKVGRIEGEN